MAEISHSRDFSACSSLLGLLKKIVAKNLEIVTI